MINESYFTVHQNHTDFEGRDGRIYSGLRWIVKDADGERVTTAKTRKEAVEKIQNNFGIYADIRSNVGGRIRVKANEVLGTEATMATITEVTSYGYRVHLDGDDPEWDGPVTRDGEILCDMGPSS